MTTGDPRPIIREILYGDGDVYHTKKPRVKKVKKVRAKREECNGTGFEICDNPDHGFIGMLSFHDIGRSGCPLCGHDELHRIKSSKCQKCGGTGFQEIVDELVEGGQNGK